MSRPRLTRESVVAEAAAIVDEVGFERMTLAAVANRLGVSLPALYKHVDGLSGLQRDIAILGVRELTAATAAAAIGKSGRDALHAIAAAYREYAHAHPGVVAASLRAPAPGDEEHAAAGAGAVRVMRAAFAGYDLDDDCAVHAVRAIRVVLQGFVVIEAAQGFGLPNSVDDTFAKMIDGLHAAVTVQARTHRPGGLP